MTRNKPVKNENARAETASEARSVKILVGVDEYRTYQKAIALLGRLQIPGAGLLLAHLGEPIFSPGLIAQGVGLTDVSEGGALEERQASAVLEEAERVAFQSGIGLGSELFYWPANVAGPIEAGERLCELADYRKVEMVAVGSEGKEPLERLLWGSVGATLAAHAHRSFLIARGDVTEIGPVKIVFGTDLSAYADRCLERLLNLAPKGLAEIALVCANDGRADLAHPLPPEDWGSAVDSGAAMRRRGQEWVTRLAGKGYSASFTLEDGAPRDVLPKAMARTGADMLVLGARGHGALRRLFLGSVACQQVNHALYSVWVVRLSDVD